MFDFNKKKKKKNKFQKTVTGINYTQLKKQ